MAKRKRISFTAWGIRIAGGLASSAVGAGDVAAKLASGYRADTLLYPQETAAANDCEEGETPVHLRIEEIEK